ncbi:MAG: hypothetical protein ACJA2S_004721 [Cyclobacteriaceae bacterium]|jgi:hypothetical protein
MSHIVRLSLYLFIATILIACQRNNSNTNHLYDFGTPDAQLAKGFTAVQSASEYDPQVGYGWINSSFERKDFNLEKVKPLDMLLMDGIAADDSLVFRIDAARGNYVFTISLGNGTTEPMDMAVTINGELVNDSTSTPWLRIKYRAIAQKVHLKTDYGIIKIASKNGRGVAVHGMELRPVIEWKDFKTATLLNQDTLEISKQIKAIEHKLIKEPYNTQYFNQLNILNKYKSAAYFYDIGWWSWAVEQTGLSVFDRYHIASDLLRQVIVDVDGPLYDRSVYLLARVHYWLYKEQGNEYNRESYEKYFNILNAKFPDHPMVKMYNGDKVAHKSPFGINDPKAPAWANYQRESIHRLQEMTHWWADSIQADNGELGGSFGDDVEILRWWLPSILGADDQKARAGYTKLVNGVWNSGLLERAFSKKVEDVEHAAELFRDTHPAMFLMNYGNPIYVERCLVSMQNFRDLWTGINSYGHRHFKSCYLSASEIDETAPNAVDVPLNARATLPGLWATWYNQNPSTMDLFSEWGASWVEDAARAENGKPAGVFPAAVSYADDKIGGYAEEWHAPGEGLGWGYFDWESLGHVCEMYNQLLGLYAITGQESLLKPMNTTFDYMMSHKNPKNIDETIPGSEEWTAAQLWGKTKEGTKPNNSLMKLFGAAKAITGTTRYDDLIEKSGRHYSQYLVTGEEKYIEEGLEEILGAIRYNYPLFTTEVKFTDRVYVPNDDLLFGMYTGHIGSGYEFPGLSATWKNTGPEMAILVGKSGKNELNAQLYNFGDSKEIGMHTWQLVPGRYRLTLTAKGDNGEELLNKELEINERTSYTAFYIPANKLIKLHIEQLSKYKALAFPRADVAISIEDVTIKADWDKQGDIPVNVTVHNIGNKSAKAIEVKIYDTHSNSLLGTQKINALEAPNDLEPRSIVAQVSIPKDMRNQEIKVLLSMAGSEITLLNNEVKSELQF